MAENGKFTIHVEQQQDFEFKVRFDWDTVDDLILDEPEPLGGEAGPNASRLVAAAVGNCLSASLFFCLQKARAELNGEIATAVTGRVERNDKGRMRLADLDVQIRVPVSGGQSAVRRCLGLFEDFCVVTESIRSGIPVSVEVVDAEGRALSTEAGD
jgi:organic hydroperoxide reductase OsmC/OhrA